MTAYSYKKMYIQMGVIWKNIEYLWERYQINGNSLDMPFYYLLRHVSLLYGLEIPVFYKPVKNLRFRKFIPKREDIKQLNRPIINLRIIHFYLFYLNLTILSLFVVLYRKFL